MADIETIKRLENEAYDMRVDLLRLCFQAGILHIGGDLSITDIVTCLYQYVMNFDPKNPKWEGRDRFILSKGHCAGAVYMAQAHTGYFDKQELLNTYLRLDSRFGMHPCADMLDSFEISTGSLGHGLSIAIGMALAARMDRKMHRVFVIMGDGETQEGSVWEGLMAGPQFKLGNLVVVVDRNGLSMDGPTEKYMKLEPYADKFRAFNWNLMEIDGNDMEQLCDAFDQLPPVDSNVPTLILAHTVKGKGIDFMENNPLWHAGCLKDEETLCECIQQIEFAREKELGVAKQ
jgi:transketolase